jgi:iron complex transport system substrate-binding protein
MRIAKRSLSGGRGLCTLICAWIVANCLLPGPSAAGLRVTDDSGRPVVLAAPARRIISLAPHVTELLFAAGAGDAVVGVSEYSDYPEAARRLPRIGGGGGLDLERILALQPDLVVAWQSGNPAFQVQRLRELGLAVFVSEPQDLAAIAHTIARLARLAGTWTAARPVIEAYNRHLRGLHATFADRTPVRVYFQVWDRPLMTVNGAHLVSDVLRLCGGRNVFAGLPELAPQVDIEAVLQRDPQVIFVAAGPDEAGRQLTPWRHWRQLAAVRQGHLYEIRRERLVRHTPRILDGAERLCRLLDRARADEMQERR